MTVVATRERAIREAQKAIAKSGQHHPRYLWHLVNDDGTQSFWLVATSGLPGRRMVQQWIDDGFNARCTEYVDTNGILRATHPSAADRVYRKGESVL